MPLWDGWPNGPVTAAWLFRELRDVESINDALVPTGEVTRGQYSTVVLDTPRTVHLLGYNASAERWARRDGWGKSSQIEPIYKTFDSDDMQFVQTVGDLLIPLGELTAYNSGHACGDGYPIEDKASASVRVDSSDSPSSAGARVQTNGGVSGPSGNPVSRSAHIDTGALTRSVVPTADVHISNSDAPGGYKPRGFGPDGKDVEGDATVIGTVSGDDVTVSGNSVDSDIADAITMFSKGVGDALRREAAGDDASDSVRR